MESAGDDDAARRLAMGMFNAESDRQVKWRIFVEAQIDRALQRTEDVARQSATASRFAALAAGISASAAVVLVFVEILRLALGR